jgi:hypothetical protein
MFVPGRTRGSALGLIAIGALVSSMLTATGSADARLVASTK